MEDTGAQSVEIAIIGGGPAGLAAGVNLVRNLRSVMILDSNRPRHSATLQAHGFLTRDGVSPLELRRLGRKEFEAYEMATFRQALVTSVRPLDPSRARELGFDDGIGFELHASGIRGGEDVHTYARRVLITAGLVEELPPFPSIRVYYGTALHSCVECDGFEKSDAPLALIGETSDLYKRALLVGRFSSDLIVFTNGADTITSEQEAHLDSIGIPVERRKVQDLLGVQSEMTGVRLEDSTVIPRVGGFVRPRWHAPVEFLHTCEIERNEWGLLTVDTRGETSTRGLYATGDIVPPGPRSLMIAAGGGAQVALRLNMDLLRATHNLSTPIPEHP